jgi:hypothetical protein
MDKRRLVSTHGYLQQYKEHHNSNAIVEQRLARNLDSQALGDFRTLDYAEHCYGIGREIRALPAESITTIAR